MRFIDEYRDKKLIEKIIKEIKLISRKNVKLMEVCGGHTYAIKKYGLNNLLPENIKLVSGPGCPVCVTSISYINNAIELAKNKNIIIATYGDLLRVPGTKKSLASVRAEGANIKIVYSTLEAIELAEKYPDKEIVFLGIGFETTTPSSAVAILKAKEKNLKNFTIYSAHKLMPPAMMALINEGIGIDGYIGPGHVSTIGGAKMYEPVTRKCKVPIVISGFEPLDILQSVYMLIKQIEENDYKVEIQYKRAVTYEGNIKAQEYIKKIFIESDDYWRGLGLIDKSGLKIHQNYSDFDAAIKFNLKEEIVNEKNACRCGEVLKGLINPFQCPLFSKVCNPENPIGACMVSSEGACQAFYLYGN